MIDRKEEKGENEKRGTRGKWRNKEEAEVKC